MLLFYNKLTLSLHVFELGRSTHVQFCWGVVNQLDPKMHRLHSDMKKTSNLLRRSLALTVLLCLTDYTAF